MQHQPTRAQGWRTLALLLFVVLGLTACQPVQPVQPKSGAAAAPAAPGEIPQVTITARDFAFEMPDELPSGLVSVTLRNEGAFSHHAILLRLKEGVTLDQVKEALAAPEGEEDGDELADLDFFMPDTDPGASNEATVDLAPGTWVIFSVSMSDFDDPIPDWARGSIKRFTVAGNSAPAATPQPDLVLTLGPDDVDMPAELSAGTHMIQVVNASGTDDGFAFFLRLEGDATVEDILADFESLFTGQLTSPEEMAVFHAVGGLMGYTLSDSFYTTIDFAPGNYAVITSINGEGFPYSGLSRSFTVR